MATGGVSGLTVTLTVENTPLASTTDYTLTINQEVIDETSDDSARWEELIVGRRSWSIDADFFYIYNDAAAVYLEEHVTAGNPASVSVVLTTPNNNTYSGEGIVTSFVISRNFEDAIKASCTIRGTAALATATS